MLYNVPVYYLKTQINRCVDGELILLSKRCYLCCRFRYSVLIFLFTNISGSSASLMLRVPKNTFCPPLAVGGKLSAVVMYVIVQY